MAAEEPTLSLALRSPAVLALVDVEHVARLARLDLIPADRERMQGQLATILGYVEQLRRVDTRGIAPTAHVLPLANVMREDEMRPSYPVDAMLGNAPDPEGEYVRVPRILEE